MASEWFYTTNKQQMGPVTWKELRELADGEILKPHDMVWTEGMDEWVKAIHQNGLFADEGADGETATAKKKKRSSYTEAKPPPARRSKRTEDDEEDDEDDEDEKDDKEEKRKARKRQQNRTKMAVGVKVGLILAGILLLLLLLGCAGGLLFYWGFAGGGGGGPRTQNYTINNLPARAPAHERRFNFRQGGRVIVTATSNTQFPNTDVDLYVFRGNNPNPIAMDENLTSNSRVDFIAPANDSYRVVILNRGPGSAFSTRVTVEEK